MEVYGGLERVVAQTINLLSENGNQVTLIVLDKSPSSFFPIHQNIQIINIPSNFGITTKGNIISRKLKMLTDIQKLKKILLLLSPSAIIGSEYPFSIAAVLAMKGKAKIFSWEHTHFNPSNRNRFWNKLFRLYYPKLDSVICLNEDEKKLYSPFNKSVNVIPNFITPKRRYSDLNQKIVLTVTRLIPAKGIAYLLLAASNILQMHPTWKWKIIGDGEMWQEAVKFVTTKKLEGRLVLQKATRHDIEKEYAGASLFVTTSLQESFGMVLAEAMSYGLPCISFDCDTGPRHIITNNEDGLLVEKENPEKLAAAISLLIENEDLRKKMGEKAIANVQRFSPEKIYDFWKELLDN